MWLDKPRKENAPLAGLKVLELARVLAGPWAGQILADLGADVIKVESPEGDNTRRLKGFGTGYFPFYSRNKKSLAVDLISGPAAAPGAYGTRVDVIAEAGGSNARRATQERRSGRTKT